MLILSRLELKITKGIVCLFVPKNRGGLKLKEKRSKTEREEIDGNEVDKRRLREEERDIEKGRDIQKEKESYGESKRERDIDRGKELQDCKRKKGARRMRKREIHKEEQGE